MMQGLHVLADGERSGDGNPLSGIVERLDTATSTTTQNMELSAHVVRGALFLVL